MALQTIETNAPFTVQVDGRAMSAELLITEDEIQTRVREMGQSLADYYISTGRSEVHVLTILNGALHFASDLRRAMIKGYEGLLSTTSDSISLSSYSGAHSSGVLRLEHKFDSDKMDGADVLVVEDIFDSGLTLQWLTGYMKEGYDLNSLEVATLLSKDNPKRPEGILGSTALHVGFEIPDHFVIGYGLDYDQRYRDLGGIYQLV